METQRTSPSAIPECRHESILETEQNEPREAEEMGFFQTLSKTLGIYSGRASASPERQNKRLVLSSFSLRLTSLALGPLSLKHP